MNEYRATEGKWWLPGTERYRVKLSANSRSPITEVNIYDGERLFRRFIPNGKEVKLVFDLPHDQQRNLVAIIKDADGKTRHHRRHIRPRHAELPVHVL